MRKHHIYGGYLKDVPLPWIRLFDDKRRHRCVTARVMTWVGITSGAEHYYARIREEDDPILDTSPGFIIHDKPAWRLCWDDRIGEGKEFNSPPLLTKVEAYQWIRNTKDKKFPKHRLTLVPGRGISKQDYKAFTFD